MVWTAKLKKVHCDWISLLTAFALLTVIFCLQVHDTKSPFLLASDCQEAGTAREQKIWLKRNYTSATRGRGETHTVSTAARATLTSATVLALNRDEASLEFPTTTRVPETAAPAARPLLAK